MFDQGLFRRADCLLHVHQGNFVVGVPPRLGTAPEIALFELRGS